MVKITPTQKHWSELRGSDLCDLPEQTQHPAAGPVFHTTFKTASWSSTPAAVGGTVVQCCAFPSDQMHFSIFSSFHKYQQPEKQWRLPKYQISESSQNETLPKIFPTLWNSHTHTPPQIPRGKFLHGTKGKMTTMPQIDINGHRVPC